MIQDHVRDTVVVPDNIDHEAVETVTTVAHLIRYGELRGTWTDMTMHLHEGVLPADLAVILGGQGALAVESSWALELAGHTYDMGVAHRIAATTRLADEQPEDGRSVRLVPADDNTMIQRLGPLPTSDESE